MEKELNKLQKQVDFMIYTGLFLFGVFCGYLGSYLDKFA